MSCLQSRLWHRQFSNTPDDCKASNSRAAFAWWCVHTQVPKTCAGAHLSGEVRGVATAQAFAKWPWGSLTLTSGYLVACDLAMTPPDLRVVQCVSGEIFWQCPRSPRPSVWTTGRGCLFLCVQILCFALHAQVDVLERLVEGVVHNFLLVSFASTYTALYACSMAPQTKETNARAVQRC